MKTKTDRVLLTLFLGSSVLSILSILMWIELIPDFGIPIDFRGELALILSAFPLFSLQLLLCRNAGLGWVKGLPALILAGTVLLIFLKFVTSRGWDGLGWLFLLILCIPLAIGITLGWLVHWIMKKRCHR